jgi:DNA (cytosine-5)-methyltransferase 1
VVPPPRPLQVMHLCSGYGGFELALRLAGVDARTVAHVERDAYAAATLVARMADEALDRAPVWSDLVSFDARGWAGRVDLVTAGFPCQPFSAAGQGRGVDDERWIWPDIARIISELGPRFVFLENVPRLVRLGLPHVLADLAELGFDAEWGCLSAAAVGAPHRRNRLWLLAYADRDGLGEQRRESAHDRDARDDAHRSSGAAVADPACVDGVHGGRLGEHEPERRRERPRQHSEGLANTDISRCEGGGLRQHEPVELCWPPLPDDHDGWERWIAAGGPEPQIRRVTDGRPPELADALHLGGNGLVPRVAAEALAALASRAGIGRRVAR